MQITIVCDSLEELREMADRLFVILPEGLEEQEASARHECHCAAQVDALPEKRGRGRRVDREGIMKLELSGMSAKAIATKTGYGYSTVCKILQEEKRK